MDLLVSTSDRTKFFPLNDYYPSLKRFFSEEYLRPYPEEELIYSSSSSSKKTKLKGKDLVFEEAPSEQVLLYMKGRDENLLDLLVKFREQVISEFVKKKYPVASDDTSDLQIVRKLISLLTEDLQDLIELRKSIFRNLLSQVKQKFREGTQKFVREVQKSIELDWSYLASHPECPGWGWNWNVLSGNSNLDFSLVRDHPGWKWDWTELSRNRNLDFSLVRDHPQWNWNWNALSRNRNLDFSLVRDHPDWNWNWFGLSENPNLDFTLVDEFPSKPWNQIFLRENKLKRQDIYETYLSINDLIENKLFGKSMKESLASLRKAEVELLKRKAYQEETRKLEEEGDEEVRRMLESMKKD